MIPLYIYLRADGGRGFFVQSAQSAVLYALRRFHRGERVRFKLVFLDPFSSSDVRHPFEVRDCAGYHARVAIRKGGALLAFSSSWTWNAQDDCFYGTLSLSTAEMNAALATAGESLRAIFEVELSGGPSSEVVKADQAVEVLTSALTEEPQVVDPLELVEYYNKGATDIRFVQNRSTITGLTGGGDFNLDGIPTTSDAQGLGVLAAVVFDNVVSLYQLQSGVLAQSLPEIIRPADFDAGTNARLWRRVFLGSGEGALRYWAESTTPVGGLNAAVWTPKGDGYYALTPPVLPDVTTGALASFGAQPAGSYRVRYVRGALRYIGGFYNLNASPVFGFRVVHSNGTEIEGPHRGYTQFPTVAEVEAANAGAEVEFVHDGTGIIGVRLEDAPLNDNVVGTPAPTFELLKHATNLHAVVQARGTGSVIECDGLDVPPAPTSSSQKVERFAGGYRRLGGNAAYEGRVAGADPVDAQDFVTKAWHAANLGGGGGAATRTEAAGEQLAARDLVFQDVTNALGGGRTKWWKVDVAASPPRLGPRLGMALAVDDGVIGAAGASWSARDSARNWLGVAMSADGVKQVAIVQSGRIYTSTDSGATWTARDSSRNWRSVASSSDGSKLVACVDSGQIYTSTDSGVTWTARESDRAWSSVASSANGTKLIAAEGAGQLYTSTDSGVTWTARESNRDWVGVASSEDGVKLVAVGTYLNIWTSADSGVTWTESSSGARPWHAVASSSDGVKLVAVATAGRIYTSTDSGTTWTARDSNRQWLSVASSSDGFVLLAGVNSGQLYVSTDSGFSWTARDSNRAWLGVSCSSSGAVMLASAYGGFLYTSAGAFVTGAFLCQIEAGEVAGFTGLTPGARQFASGTAGALTETEPAGLRRLVGYAVAADTLYFTPQAVETPQHATPAATRYLDERGRFTVPAGGAVQVWDADFTGAIDGSNVTFVMAQAYVSGTLRVTYGGIRQKKTHFTETSNLAVTLNFVPELGPNGEVPDLVFDYEAE